MHNIWKMFSKEQRCLEWDMKTTICLIEWSEPQTWAGELEMSLTLGLTLKKDQQLDCWYYLQMMQIILCLWVLKALLCSM